jgi:hypothetical protein
LTAVLLAAVGGGLALILQPGGTSHRGDAPSEQPSGGNAGSSQQLAAEAAARRQAVAWILAQVSRTAIVGCDAQVCEDLARGRFPNLQTLGPGSFDPLGTDLIVSTAAIRAQYRSRLASVYAPAIIASFGSGSTRIDIRLTARDGAVAFLAAEQAALRTRKHTEPQLLRNRHIKLSATARAQLRSGAVDPRLPALIAQMAHSHRVQILDFGDRGPGGGPADLLRSVDFAMAVPGVHLTRAKYLSWMQSYVKVEQAQYRPWSHQATSPTGQAVFRIGYYAPSPLS